MAKAPSLFIGHGSPMNALELNDFTQAWRGSVATGSDSAAASASNA